MTRPVAVVAHNKKMLGGGLGELRELLAAEGITSPGWYEVDKSRKVPRQIRRALAAGAKTIFVYGGDGTVQRSIDTVTRAGAKVRLAILPAGTANLLARNLSIPVSLPEAVQVGLHGTPRRLDTGSVNHERFAVMAGAGLDARMLKEADGGMKDRFGRAAYLWTGAKNVSSTAVKARVTMDGETFFKGRLSCLLVGNLNRVLGHLEVFDGSSPDDGVLELGVITATGPVEWARTAGRVATGRAEKSPFVQTGRGRKFTVRFEKAFPYELDGGARPPTKKLRIKVHPGSVQIQVPSADNAAG